MCFSKLRDVIMGFVSESAASDLCPRPTFIYVPFDDSEHVWDNKDSISEPVMPQGQTPEELIFNDKDIDLLNKKLGCGLADWRATYRGNQPVNLPLASSRHCDNAAS